MIKKNCCILIILFFVMPLCAQRETANWYFGSNVGLDFNSGIPELITNGQMITTEGCSTVSDNSGDLLFYTNGVKIWDKTHNVMQNGSGLLGDISSSQSAIVIPNVSNTNIYYVFTADVLQAYQNGGDGNGFNYSIIDMSLNGGLGRVINKNINLLSQSSEKLTAVSTLDGSGFWVITHSRNKFYAYKVDSSGINAPIISTVGIDIDNYNNIRGSIKLSPNGKKLAIAHSIFSPNYNGHLLIYDFNLNTGIVSNEKQIATDRLFYGVEFSPDSSKLYASGMLLENSGTVILTTDVVLYQYNLSFPDIGRTEYLINTYESSLENNLGGSVQLGFDKKLYHTLLEDKLSVIHEPNLSRRSMDYREYDIDLDGRLTYYGLPSYEQSAFESIVKVESLCFNNATNFNIIIDEPIQTISWDFGDPNSGINNVSSDINPTHLFTSTGLFTITMTVDFVNRATKTYIEFIEIGEPPTFVSLVEIVQCDDDADDGITKFNLAQAESLFALPDNEFAIAYFESIIDAVNNENGLDELNYVNTSNGQIIYAKIFENADCYSIVEVKLIVEPMSNLGEYSSAFICKNDPLDNLTFEIDDVMSLLQNDFPGSNISLYLNESNALMEFNELTGIINLSNVEEVILNFRVENFNACAFIGSIKLSGAIVPILEDQTTIFCTNDINFLDAGDGFWFYLWSTGETTNKIEISSPGTYWVEVSTGIDCSDIMIFDVIQSNEFDIVNIEVEDFRPKNSVKILLDDYSGNLRYSLDGITFSDSNLFNDVTPGIYDVMVIKDDCHFVEQTILVGGYPKYFTPNGDGINDTWRIKEPQYFQEAKINIYDRYGKLLQVMSADNGWDGKFKGSLLAASDYWFSVSLNNKIVFGHFTLKR